MSLDKSNIEWLLALGYVYIQTHKFTKALAVLNVVLVSDDKNAEALKLTSFAYFEKGQYDKAFSAIKQWMGLPGASRGETIAMFLLQARVLLRLKRKDLAKKCLLKYIALIEEEEKIVQESRENPAHKRSGRK